MLIPTWNGYDYLVPLLAVIGGVGGHYLLKFGIRDSGRWESVSFFIIAALLFFVTYALRLKPKPNIFWHLHMWVWGVFAVIFGVVILITG
jgi:hypothetical protein